MIFINIKIHKISNSKVKKSRTVGALDAVLIAVDSREGNDLQNPRSFGAGTEGYEGSMG